MFLIYDTETTGLPKDFNAPLTDFDNWPRLVQIAWQLHDDNGHLVEANNLIVKPEGFTIPFNSVKIHGISTEMAEEEGHELTEVLESFNKAVKQAKYVVGHNISFDLNIVGCEYLRKEKENELSSLVPIDTKDESTDFCAIPGGKGGKFKYPTLSELHQKLFSRTFGEAHNAAADVEATARSFFKLCDLGVIQRDDISLDEAIMDHLAEKAKEILGSIDYSIEGEQKAELKVDKAKAEAVDGTFIHLHNHTQFSVLQSTSKLDELIKKAVADKQPAVAMTDTGNMFGAFKFVTAARAVGITPIVGCELNICKDMRNHSLKDDGHHMVFLAKNKTAYHRLAKLCSLANVEGFYYLPRVDKEEVVKYKEDLIVLSGGLFGELADLILNQGPEQAEQSLLWWKEQFGEDFYLELNRHGLEEEKYVNEQLLALAAKHEIKCIAANNCYYLDKKDANAHDILLCVKEGETQGRPKKYVGKKGREYRFGFPNDEFYFKSQEEMKALFADIPEAVENIQEILDKIEGYDLASDVLLPKFDIPEEFKDPKDLEDGKNRGENNYLRHLTYEGAKKRYGEITDEIKERLDFELETIAKTGYPGYFLIVQDFTSEARKMGVSVGPGRGSAAGSAVAYCIEITNVDPIAYDLLFERFLNPERVSMPDIDIDFDDERRQLILNWVVNKYGMEQVAQIVTYGTMAAKSAIRDTARVLALPIPEADKLAKLVPDNTSLAKIFGDRNKLKEKLNGEELQQADQLIELAKTKGEDGEALRQAKVLEGSLRNTGIHACGVIIAPTPLMDHLPVLKPRGQELLVTQFDNSVVENAGLLKMDFLGLKTLTIIRDAIKNIEQRHGVVIDPDEIPLDDEKTYELYQLGATNGTFQFESVGMQKHLKALKPDRFEDLIAMNALYRPGPMEYIPNFIARKHGREEIAYDVPEMEEFLAETYGITVYQEQVMLLSQKLAGFTKGQADALRKGMGKKKKSILDELKPKFFSGCEERGISEEKANKIWTDWEAFAAYAFNKSHSTCYSVVAFHTAYLKANYPAEYMASVLTHNMNDIKKVTFFMEECKRMGIPVLGPDVNEARLKFTVNDKGEIRFGLGGVKGVGHSAVEAIVEERENGMYRDIFDFATRIDLKSVNKRCFESLAISGGFDCFEGVKRKQYFEQEENEKYNLIEKAIRYGSEVKHIKASAGSSLFGGTEDEEIPRPKINPIENDWPLMMKLNKEKDVIGFYISGHPLDTYEHEIGHFCNTNLHDLQEKTQGNYLVAGIITAAQHRVSQKGDGWGHFVIEDYSGSMEFRLFKESYLKYKHFIEENLIVYLKVNVKRNSWGEKEIRFNVTDIKHMDEARSQVKKNLCLNLNLQHIEKEQVGKIVKLVQEHPGNSNLLVNVYNENENMKLALRSKKFKVELNNDLFGTLKRLENVNYQLTK